MIDGALLTELHAIRAVIAPELTAPYILAVNELPSELREGAADALGFAVHSVQSLAFADALGDRWIGPRDVIMLDAAAIAGAAACPAAVPGCIRNTFIHELGHLLPAAPLLSVLPKDYSPPAEARQFALQRMACDLKMPAPEMGHPDDHHDSRFCRRSLHLFVRATLCNFEIPLRGLFGSWKLSDATHYLPVLLAEAVALRDATFKEIEETPAPPAFEQMWAADLQHYQDFFARTETCSAS